MASAWFSKASSNGTISEDSNVNGIKRSKTPPFDATEAYKSHAVAYNQSKQPLMTSRPIKVIAAGAGASGLSLAHEVQIGTLQNVDLQIFEKNQGVGGTWFENQYPGYVKLLFWVTNKNLMCSCPLAAPVMYHLIFTR
jgi:hypothetical protein